MPASRPSRSLVKVLLRLISAIGTPRSIAAHIRACSLADGERDVMAECLAHVGDADRLEQALFIAVDDHPNVDVRQGPATGTVRAGARAVEAGTLISVTSRTRSTAPAATTTSWSSSTANRGDRSEFARAQVDDGHQMVARPPFQRDHFSRGGRLRARPNVRAVVARSRSPSILVPASISSARVRLGRSPSWNATSPNWTSKSIRHASRPYALRSANLSRPG